MCHDVLVAAIDPQNSHWNLIQKVMRPLGGDEVLRVEPSGMGLVHLKKSPREIFSLSSGDTARGQLSVNQEAVPH